MRRSSAISSLVGRLTQYGVVRVEKLGSGYTTMVQPHIYRHCTGGGKESSLKEDGDAHAALHGGQEIERSHKPRIGENVSRKDRFNFLVSTLLDMKDSKQSVYGALDAWVAWEQNFPLASLRRALVVLEEQHQWHRMVQVIKWMLSKGQGNTMGTYGVLIRALDMDHRAEEAHRFWVKKIGSDLHSVPWSLCTSMIAIYYRNNMLEHLIKLFKGLEAFDRKPPEKSVVRKVADAYEVSGLVEEKTRLLEKYDYLFTESHKGSMKHTRSTSKKGKKSGQRKKTDLPLEPSTKTDTNNHAQRRD
ncbi:pentatricopeptide repeat-containing protein At4g18975, chloroplastic [Rhodamnia argentea]|uniref:Pentatricopeptide repeat-containing protein At4g18975, chloroplastic n=1 Tax=Rhodamnia argentea TaxID=178133 RepID=A0A8B8NZX3_9MYRT|nr:pentatricopeptide repeat-containing protein At4g18975, chloroplastic [Rhodamnia argentea]XP_048126935.1 pentatricopeptide repeat-containing protein At4g18975, chloroplastic [Rhodamnia argentea]